MSGGPMNALPEERDLVFIAEWLAQQFLSPPGIGQVEAARSMPGQIALRRIGDCLGQPAAADVTLAVQRRHTALFEGIFRQCSVPPYASLWDGIDRLCGPAVDRTRAVLRDLDMHVQADCTEPPDHLAIQLAALAEAMRQRWPAVVADLTDQMQVWTGRFAAKRPMLTLGYSTRRQHHGEQIHWMLITLPAMLGQRSACRAAATASATTMPPAERRPTPRRSSRRSTTPPVRRATGRPGCRRAERSGVDPGLASGRDPAERRQDDAVQRA